MKKSYTVEKTCNGMRIDRWIRHSLGSIPQGLIEKHLRAGKIKINKKRIKSSHKVKTNDEINLFNIDFKETIPLFNFSKKLLAKILKYCV